MNISHFPYILFNRFKLKIFGEIVSTIKLKKVYRKLVNDA